MKYNISIVQKRRFYCSIILITMFIIFHSCIIQINSRKFDDGSTALTHSDSLLLQPFNKGDFSKEYTFNSPSEIKFQVINAENIAEILPVFPHTWITIGASWCPVSQQSIIKFNKITKEFDHDSLRWIFISQDYNLPKLQQQLFDAGINHISYLLDSEKYGKNELFKQEKFAKDLSEDIPVQAFKGGGVPISLLINKDRHIEYLFGGIKVNEDSITKYTFLYIDKK